MLVAASGWHVVDQTVSGMPIFRYDQRRSVPALDLFKLVFPEPGERVDRSKSAEMGDFYDSHPSDALYQGTTLVGPLSPYKVWASAPALFSYGVGHFIDGKGLKDGSG
jgi:hypothetical protein